MNVYVRSRTSFHGWLCEPRRLRLYVRASAAVPPLPLLSTLSLSLSLSLPTTLAAAAFSFHVLPTIQFIRGDYSRHRGWFPAIPPQRSQRSSPVISSLVEPCPYHRPYSLNRDAHIEESPTFPRSCVPSTAKHGWIRASTLASSCVRDSQKQSLPA